jgi:cytochrome P450
VVREIEEITSGDAVRAEHVERLTYLRQVVQEAMRLYPPAAVLGRSAISDVEIGDQQISRRTAVYIPVYAIHRHLKIWENPDVFDPNRFSETAVKYRHRFAYLPFGAGPRICIGMSFAMLEAVAVLATVIRRATLANPPGFVPELNLRVTLRPRTGMPVHVSARSRKRHSGKLPKA